MYRDSNPGQMDYETKVITTVPANLPLLVEQSCQYISNQIKLSGGVLDG